MKGPLLLAFLVLALLAGCGSNDAAPVGEDADLREVTLACLTEEHGIEAHIDGDEEIVLGGPAAGTHIRFFLTAGEAEAAQFEGEGEGAEQIGAALLFVSPEVRPETEEILGNVEKCLAEQ